MPTLKLGMIQLLQTFVLVWAIRQICWFDKVRTITLVKRCLHVQTNRELVCIPLIHYIWIHRQHCFIYNKRKHILYKTNHTHENTRNPWSIIRACVPPSQVPSSALPARWTIPSPVFQRIRQSQTVSSFDICTAQACQFLPKGKGQSKIILFLPLFYDSLFLSCCKCRRFSCVLLFNAFTFLFLQF